jgi:hypothetical protein
MPRRQVRFTANVRGLIVAPQAVKIEAVGKVSGWRKAGIAVRVARDQAGRSRTVRAAVGAVRTTSRSVGRVLHQLWLEVTGFVFLVMAIGFGSASVREFGKYHAGEPVGGRLALGIVVTVTFGWFALSSFWRAGRKSHRP